MRARPAGEHARLVAEMDAGRLPRHRHVLEYLGGLARELERIDAKLAAAS